MRLSKKERLKEKKRDIPDPIAHLWKDRARCLNYENRELCVMDSRAECYQYFAEMAPACYVPQRPPHVVV